MDIVAFAFLLFTGSGTFGILVRCLKGLVPVVASPSPVQVVYSGVSLRLFMFAMVALSRAEFEWGPVGRTDNTRLLVPAA